MDFLKSRLFGVGIPKSELHHMASILGCCEGNFAFTYLSELVGASIALKKALETYRRQIQIQVISLEGKHISIWLKINPYKIHTWQSSHILLVIIQSTTRSS